MVNLVDWNDNESIQVFTGIFFEIFFEFFVGSELVVEMFCVGRVVVSDEEAVGNHEADLGDEKNPSKLGQACALRHLGAILYAAMKNVCFNNLFSWVLPLRHLDPLLQTAMKNICLITY
jgi:hypothetical protein